VAAAVNEPSTPEAGDPMTVADPLAWKATVLCVSGNGRMLNGSPVMELGVSRFSRNSK